MGSRDSSPRSTDNPPSFEDPPPSKVKLMCSFGGRIQPRPHDNHLTYVAGDTKILAVDRHVKFPALLAKLSALASSPNNTLLLKYQLPGEDLDALISVTNDEDLHHMMLEYDRLCRASPRPARLRLFLFPLHTATNFATAESKPERQWFVDALNSVQVPLPQGSPPPPPPPNPDFLFGLDKPAVPDARRGNRRRSRRLEKPNPNLSFGGCRLGTIMSRFRSGRVYGVDSFAQKNAENVTPLVAHAQVHSGTVPGTVSFLQERNSGGYSLAVPTTRNEIYLIQTPSGIFQAVRPVAGPVGQPVYLVHAPGSEVGMAPERGYSAAGRGGARW
ncbi:clustered mitochondria protein [Spatholobus suberectus]|nr:clustered mitochondria protein [Spatholobus suberectus]